MSAATDYMARALSLAALGAAGTFPNPRVGCVLVRDGQVVGEGWHARAGEPHAEVHALQQAGPRARGATAYVSLEPCAHHGRTPPCADALIEAGVAAVVVAMPDPDVRVSGRGLQRLRAAGIEVQVGLLESCARELNRGFVSRIERGRPHVTLKLAMSLDGRTAMASGESRWISSAEARADVHRLRAAAGAVLTTAQTVIDDDPELTVRVDAVPRQPDRIVLDRAARVPATARVWQPGARRLRVCGQPAEAPAGVEQHLVECAADGHLDLSRVLAVLGTDCQINSVLVESGPRFAGAMLRSGCVDEVVIYCAPCLLGDAAQPLAVLPGLDRLEQKLALRFKDVRQVGPDLKITAAVGRSGG